MSHETFNTLDNHEEILNMMDIDFFQLYLFQGDVHKTYHFIKNFFDIKDDLKTLKVAHFILSPQVSSLIKFLPDLLRNLSHSTYRKDEEMKGRIRGKINWNNTIKTRLSSGYNDKTIFVCSPPNKNYNLEENQLIKFLLKEIIHLRDYYLPFANPSKYEFDFERINEDKDWYTKVKNCYEVCKRTLKKVYFNDIDDVDEISYRHLKKTINHKNFLYSKVVFDVYRLYYNLFIKKDENILKMLINQRIIISRDSNKLFELYILFELIKKLPGQPKYKLLSEKKDNMGNEYLFEICNDDECIYIYYQKTPKVLKDVSMYKKICKGYSIGCNVRAPDIILKYGNSGKFRLIEVKNTDDKDYMRDSIYKVMGYLKDFEGNTEENLLSNNFPVVLVIFKDIYHQKQFNWKNEEIVIFNKDEFIKYLNEGIFDNQ